MLSAIESGKYDTNKLALLITQTGGGCRASNYIFLLRKALKKAGYGHIPVISLNFAGLEKGSAFKVTAPLAIRLLYAAILGDLIMLLRNQCLPYELNAGDTERVCDKWVARLTHDMAKNGKLKYAAVKQFYKDILADFAAIPRSSEKKVRVGIVGEIFVKFSPLGNNELEKFLLSENAEVVMPGLLDFCMFSCHNSVTDAQLLGMKKGKGLVFGMALKFFEKKQKDIIDLINAQGIFEPPTPFAHVIDLADGLIGHGAKMGEGWLLTAEMAELIEQYRMRPTLWLLAQSHCRKRHDEAVEGKIPERQHCRRRLRRRRDQNKSRKPHQAHAFQRQGTAFCGQRICRKIAGACYKRFGGIVRKRNHDNTTQPVVHSELPRF